MPTARQHLIASATTSRVTANSLPRKPVPLLAFSLLFTVILTRLLAPEFAGGETGLAGAAEPTGHERVQRVESSHLPNLVRLHDQVYSGGLPEGREAFAELQRRGIRTIISVDGASPDVEQAAEFGLRYVHLPHGYDGIPAARREQLARAIHSLPGPIYVHCHHGRHRSPAAAAAGCVGAGLLPPEAVARVLEVAGTNAGYQGLFRDAQASIPLEAPVLASASDEFVSRAELPAMTEAMVEIEQRLDAVRQRADALQQDRPRGESLEEGLLREAAHESLLLWEHYRELGRLDDPRLREPSFTLWLRDGEMLARQLHEAFARTATPQSSTAPSTGASSLPVDVRQPIGRLEHNCKACHRQYRDAASSP